MSRLALYLLGPLHIENEAVAVNFNTRKTLALFVYLAVTQQRHRRDSLANFLWPDKGHSQGRALLRNSLSDLRRELGPAWIVCIGRRAKSPLIGHKGWRASRILWQM